MHVQRAFLAPVRMQSVRSAQSGPCLEVTLIPVHFTVVPPSDDERVPANVQIPSAITSELRLHVVSGFNALKRIVNGDSRRPRPRLDMDPH